MISNPQMLQEFDCVYNKQQTSSGQVGGWKPCPELNFSGKLRLGEREYDYIDKIEEIVKSGARPDAIPPDETMVLVEGERK